MSLLPEDVYLAVWGSEPDAFTNYDLDRDKDESQEDPPRRAREYWVVTRNGQPSNQFYPSIGFAVSAARGLARSYPNARIEVLEVQPVEDSRVTIQGEVTT